MPDISGQATILLSQDVPRALAFWEGTLGFAIGNSWGEPTSFAILRRDLARVMIGAAAPGYSIPHVRDGRTALWDAYFWVNDARAIFADMKARGATFDYELYEQEYGVLEFAVRDLDGHDIGFGEVLNQMKAP